MVNSFPSASFIIIFSLGGFGSGGSSPPPSFPGSKGSSGFGSGGSSGIGSPSHSGSLNNCGPDTRLGLK